MPGARTYPNPGVPLSRRELRKHMGFSPLYDFLDMYAARDVYMDEFDFAGPALNTTNDFTAAAGAGATTWAVLASGENGVIRGIAGTTAATSGLQLSRPATFKSARNIGIEVYLQTDNVTNKRYEIGFVQALPAVNTPCVNSLVTPTFNTVTDGALYVFDNASATNTMGLYTISSVSSGQANKGASLSGGVPALVASTFTHIRLEVKGQSAYVWVNGILVAQQLYAGTGATSAMNSATIVKPVFMSEVSADTVTANIDLDYVRVYSDRITQA